MAEKIPVTNTYHGVEVIDNYQWLENADDPRTQAFTEANNVFAREALDKIALRNILADKLRGLYSGATPEYSTFHCQDGAVFALKDDPNLDQKMLVRLESLQDLRSEKVLVDPNKIDPTGRTSIEFYVVSPDTRLVAVCMSKDGTEDGDVRVYDIATGQSLPDFVPGVNGPTAGGDVAWLADGSGFVYTRYPRAGEKPDDQRRFYQQAYFHKLGTPTEEDRYEIGEQFPAIAEIEFNTSTDNRLIIAQVANGDGGEFAHYLRQPSGDWVQLTNHRDLIPSAKFGPDNDIYLLCKLDAPFRKLLRLAPGVTDLGQATTVVAESDVVLQNFVATKNSLYLSVGTGGPSEILKVDRNGRLQKTVPTLSVSTVSNLTVMGGDRILFTNQSYTEPSAAYTYDGAEGAPVKTALRTSSPADFSNVEVVREFATSKDGTSIPMNIMRLKGTVLNGANPTVLYGYGGYGSNQQPYYDRDLSLWLNAGGIYVKANIRGGGEFGEDWHLQGNLTNKQNVFDDFAACAQHLIDAGYTSPAKLAIRGGSNGGLLVGAVMTQHPELFKAVVCQRGVLDALRVELDPNGTFNVTEFGTVTNPDHFKAMSAYSPYHNVKEGQRYPDLLLTADEDDGRVLSYHSKKMAAAVEAANHGNLVLLWTTSGRGHGHGSSLSDNIALKVDIYSFLFDRLGLELRDTN